jgi:mannose-6-phosphate isomerase-like protein (cupin superfamily)
MRRTLLVACGTAAAFVYASVVTSTQVSESKAHVMVTPSSVAWGPGPAALPAGTQAAVLEGDPAKAGPFTLRLKMPEGYKIAPHYHPADEHVTVLQGTFVMGMGEKFDQAAGRELAVGSFAMMPKGNRHFAWTKGETIVQLHGIGPWGVTYVNPSDDPRKKPSE